MYSEQMGREPALYFVVLKLMDDGQWDFNYFF